MDFTQYIGIIYVSSLHNDHTYF